MMLEFKPGVQQLPPLPTEEQRKGLEQAAKRKKAREQERKKTPTYNFTLAQIEEIKRNAIRDAVRELIELTLGLPVMILFDKHGWEKEQNSEFVDDVMNLYDSYEKGYITLEDVRDALWEEAETRVQRKDSTVTLRGGNR